MRSGLQHFCTLDVVRGILQEFCILSIGDSLREFCSMAVAKCTMRDFSSPRVGDAAYCCSVIQLYREAVYRNSQPEYWKQVTGVL